MAVYHEYLCERLPRAGVHKTDGLLEKAILVRCAKLADDYGEIRKDAKKILDPVPGLKQLKYQIWHRLNEKRWVVLRELHPSEWKMGELTFVFVLNLPHDKLPITMRADIWALLRILRKAMREIDWLANTKVQYSKKSAEALLGEIALLSYDALKATKKIDDTRYSKIRPDGFEEIPAPECQVPQAVQGDNKRFSRRPSRATRLRENQPPQQQV